ncbi:MAG: peptidoglycan D,D-transpeptidase FtsI family protein, partial [Bryobacteraceae bacterium]
MDPGSALRTRRVLGFFGTGFALWAAVLLVRLFQLQVVQYEKHCKAAQKQHVRRDQLPAARGLIVDRNGSLLAASLLRDTVTVDPRHIPSAEEAAAVFSRILRLPYQPLRDKLERLRSRRAGHFVIKRRILPEESRQLRALRRPWIQLWPEVVRYYPKGTLAAHVIGSVDFEQRGVVGLERALDGEMAGQKGVLTTVADVWDRVVQPLEFDPPRPGVSLGLTLDERIQFVAERELEAAATANGCSSGSVVVMNPHTGEVLALASYPGFDPNQPPRNRQEDQVRSRNHAVSVPFEPGSVFKVVTLTAALETTSLRPETVIPCGNGRIALFGRVVHDHHPYSALSVAD